MDYTPGQIAVIQKFVDIYRSAPEVLSISEGFVSLPNLTPGETRDIGELVSKGVMEMGEGKSGIPAPVFYRFTNQIGNDIGKLKKEGKIVIR